MPITLSVHTEDWLATTPFRIANAVFTSFPGIVVEITDGTQVGRGEGLGVDYLGETPATMTAQVEEVAEQIVAGAGREALLELLPPGGARNAVDCALWDLEAKRAGKQAARRYQMINIKLDKSGGLTHGLEIAREARQRGLGLMVGCMGGTSLAMAPSFVVGLACDFHDLDGPLLLRNDRPHGIVYSGGVVSPPSPLLWG